MPFLYDVWNVKQQQWAKGLVWSRGGTDKSPLGQKHFSKTFSIFYMLNSKNRIFNPYFWIDACRMRKILLRIIREFNLLSFWWKNNRFLWNFCLAIFMGNPSLKLSEVLCNFKNSRLGLDLPISVNDRMISPFSEDFIFVKLRICKVSRK